MPTLYLKRTACFWQRGFTRTGLILLISLASACQLLEQKGSPLTDSADSIRTSEIDQRAYRSLELPNGLLVLLVSDPQSDKAAAAMDVGVGSGSDPVTREGMAHFLEHMLFLGTEKFPTAGEYQSFINQHGGSHNAFTSYDHTNYFFDIDADYLEPALDRFSQQFVAPLFSADYVERERNAVHSEYTAKLKDDGRRFFSVLRQAMDPAHPMAKFSVGNLHTLSDSATTNIRDDLLAFYEAH
jgi:insulysin